MRLSRTDLVAPVLAIVVGGVIGVSLSDRLLSRSDDVPPVTQILYGSSETLALEARGAAQAGMVTGQVTDAQTGVSVAAAQVYIRSLDLGGLSQQNGRFLLQGVPAGTYTLTVARIGYGTTDVQITVGGGQTLDQDFSLAPEAVVLHGFFKSGRVGNTETGEALSGVIITVPDLGIQTITDLEGRFQISGSLPNGRYRLKAEHVGYEVLEGEMVVPGRSEFLVLLTPTEVDDP